MDIQGATKLLTFTQVAPGATVHSWWNNANAEIYRLNAWPKVAAGAAGLVVVLCGWGMGVLLVQRAHAAGAHVIGAARGKRKLDLVAEQGADVVVDYSEPGWTSVTL